MTVLLPIRQLITAPYTMFSSRFTFINRAFLEHTKNRNSSSTMIEEDRQIRFSDLFITIVFGYLIAAFWVLKK